MVGKREDVSGAVVGIGIHGFKSAVLTCIIPYFGNSVKYIVHIFYFQPVSVGQGIQFAVVVIIFISGKSVISGADSGRIAKGVVHERILGRSRGD